MGEMQNYEVSFDCKYSHSVVVRAKSKHEARAKAWVKIFKWACKKKHWNVEVDRAW